MEMNVVPNVGILFIEPTHNVAPLAVVVVLEEEIQFLYGTEKKSQPHWKSDSPSERDTKTLRNERDSVLC